MIHNTTYRVFLLSAPDAAEERSDAALDRTDSAADNATAEAAYHTTCATEVAANAFTHVGTDVAIFRNGFDNVVYDALAVILELVVG